jgi:serine/threonine protein kinase
MFMPPESCTGDVRRRGTSACSVGGLPRCGLVPLLTSVSCSHGTGDRFCGFCADVWSLGVTLYIMLYGTTPFGKSSQSMVDVFDSIQQDAYVCASSYTLPLLLPPAAVVVAVAGVAIAGVAGVAAAAAAIAGCHR